jgi:hypothetical protein
MLAEVATLGFEKFSSEMNKNKTTDNRTDDLVKCGVTYIEFGLANEHIIDLMFNYPMKKTDFPELLAAADKAFGMLLKRLQHLHQGNADSLQLNGISMLAYVHGLLAIIRINQRGDTSAQTAFVKASSTVKENLEKMLGSFVKSLDFS